MGTSGRVEKTPDLCTGDAGSTPGGRQSTIFCPAGPVSVAHLFHHCSSVTARVAPATVRRLLACVSWHRVAPSDKADIYRQTGKSEVADSTLRSVRAFFSN